MYLLKQDSNNVQCSGNVLVWMMIKKTNVTAAVMMVYSLQRWRERRDGWDEQRRFDFFLDAYRANLTVDHYNFGHDIPYHPIIIRWV